MRPGRPLSFQDYVTIVKRRWLVILAPTLVVPLLCYAVSLTIPNRYTSQTGVLVEMPKVPDNYVKPVITQELSQRLATMQEQLLSRARLQPIIEQFGLYKKDQGRVPMESLVERMRKDVVVTTIRNDNRALSAFYISFTAESPKLAQQVCNEITSLFMEENLRTREQRAQSTTDFLTNQLATAKSNLDEQDARLAQFKMRHIGQLPGQEQANISLLAGFNTQLDAATQALSNAQQEKAYAESLIAQRVAASSDAAGGATPEKVDQQLSTLETQLVALESRYTPDHPDVVKTRREIEQLKTTLATTPDQAARTARANEARLVHEPADVQQLRAQLHTSEKTIYEKTVEQERLRRQIRLYEARVQSSPMVEEEFKKLTRDYQTALTFYNDLLTKKSQSEMATDLERSQEGEQFRVMDSAPLPETPSAPKRSFFALGGLVFGLMLGVGSAWGLEMRRDFIRNEEDVEFYLDLKTLAAVPEMSVHGLSADHDAVHAKAGRV
jgi:polysaccharide chain length determinant protein (PEP-CTERM system associated)